MVELGAPFFARRGIPRRGASTRAHAARFQLHISRHHMIAEALESGWSSTRNQSKSMRNFSTWLETPDAHTNLRAATFIRDKYGKHPPDLVITLGSDALPFIVKHRDDFPQCTGRLCIDLATDLCCVAAATEMTGIITAFDLAKTLALAERLQPEARRLFVIAGSGETDRRWQPIARKMIEDRRPQIRNDIPVRASIFGSSSPNCRRCPVMRLSCF